MWSAFQRPPDTNRPAKLGCVGWIALVFLASLWLGALVVFALYGFNPGGWLVKEANWSGAIFLWPSLMALMLASVVYFWRDRRHRRTWVVTLVLMATCPLWFVVVYAFIVEFIKLKLRP